MCIVLNLVARFLYGNRSSVADGLAEHVASSRVVRLCDSFRRLLS